MTVTAKEEAQTPRVKVQTLKEGTFYEVDGKRLGPYSPVEMNHLAFMTTLAENLGVEPREIFTAQQSDIIEPISLEEVLDIISTTVKHDDPTKSIVFLGSLLTYTEEDQVNLALQAESSAGKSYIPLEIASFFPQEDLMIIAGASPTAFFHEFGQWDEERKTITVDLERKIIVFLDMPHYMLLEKLRPLLSHDRKELMYKITDKTQRMGFRTKNVILRGYPTMIFLSTRIEMNVQDKTRVFLLSPETNEAKIKESLYLLAEKLGDRDTFKEEISNDTRRIWLRNRVQAIKQADVRNVNIENPEALCARFLEDHNHVIPRHQRDFPRLIALIKAFALLNYAHRERLSNGNIKASQEDVDAGFKLYHKVASPNELGISPSVWEIYQEVIKPLFAKGGDVNKKTIIEAYRERFHRAFSYELLRKEVIPTLEAVGLVYEEADPDDKRVMLLYPGASNHEPTGLDQTIG